MSGYTALQYSVCPEVDFIHSLKNIINKKAISKQYEEVEISESFLPPPQVFPGAFDILCLFVGFNPSPYMPTLFAGFDTHLGSIRLNESVSISPLPWSIFELIFLFDLNS